MKVGLLCSEAIRPKMAGIGIRYYELSRFLQSQGYDVVLAHPGPPCDSLELNGIKQVDVGSGLQESFQRCETVIVQGGLADSLLSQESFELPVVVDLYDPWLIENFAYLTTLGIEPFERDLSSWRTQLARGDFFMCSCESQRTFYLGFLTALGRVHPERSAYDPDFRGLVDCVSFGVPESPPAHKPVLKRAKDDEFWVYFGTVYDWYDPLILLEALVPLRERRWKLHLTRTPNPDTTPQELLNRVVERCQELGWWEERVILHDWFPVDRRFDLIRDMDLLVSPHKPDLESRLSLRTRYLDALLVGCPVIATRGGAVSDMLMERDAGWVVEPGDTSSLTDALGQVMDGHKVDERVMAGKALISRFGWREVTAPLLRFLENPRREPCRKFQSLSRPGRKLMKLWKNLF